MHVLVILAFSTWYQAAQVISSMESCSDIKPEQCLSPFMADLNNGVEVMKQLENSEVIAICRRYDVASKCIAVPLYFCPDVKKQYKDKLDAFEYACSHLTQKTLYWPLMPPYSQNITSNASVTTPVNDFEGTAIKASVAAGVTILLIMICVIADCVSKWRVRRRVKKATQQAEALLKSAEEPAEEELKKEKV